MKRILFSIGFVSIVLLVNAANVDTLDVYSNCMKKYTRTCVITPDSYSDTGKSYPVLYILPGHGGDNTRGFRPATMEFSDLYDIILVGVDGGLSSWYFDSPVDSTMKYETYITDELVSFIDNRFNTIKSRKGRAITGASMGGHGALYLAMRHQDIFGATGSMSGVVDLRPFPDFWDLAKRLGDKALYPENWNKNTVFAQLYLCKRDSLAIIIDCGVNDGGLINLNRELHEQLLYLQIAHDYIERPGGHTGTYFRNSIQYQVLFFDNFFRKEEISN